MTIIPFEFKEQAFRAVAVEEGHEFVAADLAAILGHRMASDMTRCLDDDEKGTRLVRTLGGEQELTTVTEAGLYRAILLRQTGRMADPSIREFVKRFQRWVTHEVLPAIRKTGAYAPQWTGPELLARAVLEAAETIKSLEASLEAAAPKVHAWDGLVSGAGDYTITDAAKVLTRAGAQIGPRKLHQQMLRLGWIYKNQRDKWTAHQRRLNDGCLTERARYYVDDDGVSTLATPQVRVTAKGLERLRDALSPQHALTTVAGGAA